MAWPLTPLRTYVANSTPAIKASDLNDIQDAINRAYNGTYSFKGIVIDGTGGAVVAPTSGTVKPSAVGSGSAPSATPVRFALYRDSIPLAWFYFRVSALTMQSQTGFNISGITRSSTGVYVVTLLTAGTLVDGSYCVTLTKGPGSNGFDTATEIYLQYFVNTSTTVTVRCQNTSGTPTDVSYCSGVVYST